MKLFTHLYYIKETACTCFLFSSSTGETIIFQERVTEKKMVRKQQENGYRNALFTFIVFHFHMSVVWVLLLAKEKLFNSLAKVNSLNDETYIVQYCSQTVALRRVNISSSILKGLLFQYFIDRAASKHLNFKVLQCSQVLNTIRILHLLSYLLIPMV